MQLKQMTVLVSLALSSAAWAGDGIELFPNRYLANTFSPSDIAIGGGSQATNSDNLTPLPEAPSGNIAIGSNAKALSYDYGYFAGFSIAIGNNAYANEGGLAFGRNAMAEVSSIALGDWAKASSNSVALGVGAEAFNGSVAIGYGSLAFDTNVVSFGNTTTRRRLTNIADGIEDSDAVSMNQFKALQTKVDGLASGGSGSSSTDLEALTNRVTQAETDVRAAQSTANVAQQDAGYAKALANGAQEAADRAHESALDANRNATTAQSTANDAKNTANNAATAAGAAQSTA
ncbi:alanine-zipper protein, partial [Crenobacter intestini]